MRQSWTGIYIELISVQFSVQVLTIIGKRRDPAGPTVEAMQWLGRRFVNEARRSNHSFGTAAVESSVVVDRFNVTVGPSSYQSYIVW